MLRWPTMAPSVLGEPHAPTNLDEPRVEIRQIQLLPLWPIEAPKEGRTTYRTEDVGIALSRAASSLRTSRATKADRSMDVSPDRAGASPSMGRLECPPFMRAMPWFPCAAVAFSGFAADTNANIQSSALALLATSRLRSWLREVISMSSASGVRTEDHFKGSFGTGGCRNAGLRRSATARVQGASSSWFGVSSRSVVAH